ncbi:MAG TPA: penicillin-binding protein [Verrucomicrobiales bacterium]|nr:penicillin-binding protein [Verrucomicrobiales bacterium]
MSPLTRRRFLATSTCALLARPAPAVETIPAWAAKLEGIRARYDLPALGAAIVTAEGCQSLAVTGVRKKDAETPVTTADLWHLGSNTKAMTATLAAIAVEEGKLRWDSTLGELFPRQRDLKKSPLAKATLTHLLSHWSGLPPNAQWGMLALAGGGRPGSERAQRALALELAARTADLPAPGERHEYSNFGYVLAGHMLEEVWRAPWEELMRRRLFAPLGIQNAGFGGTGTPGKLDQPWPHNGKGEPMPGNGPLVDNPPVLGPAGTVHMALADWGLFLAEHLAGRAGRGRLLKTAAYEHLHTAAQAGENYALGWLAVERPWGGRVLNHAGSNTMNRSVTWLAPEKGFGVLACANTGAETASKALDDVSGLLIQAHRQGGA